MRELTCTYALLFFSCQLTKGNQIVLIVALNPHTALLSGATHIAYFLISLSHPFVDERLDPPWKLERANVTSSGNFTFTAKVSKKLAI